VKHLLRLPLLAASLILALPVARAQPDAAEKSFALKDPGGKIVYSSDFPGRWLLIYFGYTHCLDQCPTTLGDMAQSLSDIGGLAERIQPLFITIDPARDSGPDLAAFTAAFDPRLIGLVGDEAELARVTAQFGVRYSKIASPDGGYYLDHSGALYLLDPDRRLVTRFGHMSDPAMIETKLLELMAERPPS
jgi:protein SCO1/2